MCGIAGFAGHGQASFMREAVGTMVRSLARRGPDSEGIEVWEGAVLGHRRLAILDLSDAGRQPMLSDDGRTGVVFNGCIYNFADIRAELEQHGHRFRSRCDTEVLIRGYEEWGIHGLAPRLHGMFAFSIWDDRKRKLILVRDRLGVKPLIYALKDRAIAFASTVTALRDADVVGDISPAAVAEFLEFDWVTDDRTIFLNAHKVAAGTIVEWQDGEITERPFWQLPEQGTARITFPEAVEQTERLLIDAARMRLISDVPIGALLSGGIDSGLMCWAMSKAGANITTFTVSTPGDPADESTAAGATAQALGLPHRTVALPADEQPDLHDLVTAFGEPFACASALGMLRVCKAVKPEATVLLTGDGGDDVFLGYEHYKIFAMAQNLASRVPRSLGSVLPAMMSKIVPAMSGLGPLRRASRLIDYATGGLGAVTEAKDGLPYFTAKELLGDRIRDLQLSHRQIARSAESARSLLPEVLAYEFRTRFPAEFMTKVDGASMHYAIEARSPFLDHRLWEFAASLPFEVRLKGGELKAVLRAIARRHLGAPAANRRKQGFTVPVERWLATRWAPQLKAITEDPLIESEGWIRRGKLQGVVRQAIQAGSAPRQLWSLLVLEHWLRANMTRTAVASSK